MKTISVLTLLLLGFMSLGLPADDKTEHGAADAMAQAIFKNFLLSMARSLSNFLASGQRKQRGSGDRRQKCLLHCSVSSEYRLDCRHAERVGSAENAG